MPVIPLPGGGSECVLLSQQPFVRDGHERVDFGVMLGATFCTRVNSVRYAPPSVIEFLPRSLQ